MLPTTSMDHGLYVTQVLSKWVAVLALIKDASTKNAQQSGKMWIIIDQAREYIDKAKGCSQNERMVLYSYIHDMENAMLMYEALPPESFEERTKLFTELRSKQISSMSNEELTNHVRVMYRLVLRMIHGLVAIHDNTIRRLLAHIREEKSDSPSADKLDKEYNSVQIYLDSVVKPRVRERERV